LPAVPRFDGIDGPALESQASGRTNRNYSLYNSGARGAGRLSDVSTGLPIRLDEPPLPAA
jgi:hypothetical protein